MTGNREQDAEEESSASEGERETVGKPTGRETVGKPTGRETVGKPTGRETVGKLTGRETVGKPTGRETVGKPTGKEAVGKPTGKTPDMQNVWDVTETVTEKRTMEEIPLSTWEQVLQHLSPERCEVTGESSSRTGRVQASKKTLSPER